MEENKEFNNETVSEENVNGNEPKTASATKDTAANVAETTESAETTAENAAETTETTEDAAENAAENTEETAATAFGEELAETGAGTETSADENVPEKKKNIIMKPILIAAGIVIVVALAALVIRMFFNTGLEGTWHFVRQVPMMAANATDDEAVENVNVDYYFTFSGKEVQATIGTVTSKGTYEIFKNTEGKSVVTMDLTDLVTSYNFLPYGEYEISISGNIFTGRKLVLTTPTDEADPIEMTSDSYKAPAINRENEFTPKDEITGKWVFNQNGSDLSYDFTKDGKAHYQEKFSQMNMYTGSNMTIDYAIDGIYDFSDSTITVTYIFTKESSMDISYQLDNDTLYINGFPFVREGTEVTSAAETAAENKTETAAENEAETVAETIAETAAESEAE